MKYNSKLLLIIGIVAFAIFLVYLSSSFYQIISLSIIIAYLVSPLKKRILKKIKSENIATLISMAAGSLLLVAFIAIMLLSIYNSMSGIKNILAKSEEFELAFLSITLLKNINISEILTSAGLSQLLNALQFIILIVPNMVLNSIIFLVLVFYFTKYWEELGYIIRGLIPPGELKYFDQFFEKINLVMKSIFHAQFFTAFTEASIIFIFLIILGIPYSFELALFSFIMGFLSITTMIVPLGLNVYYFYEGIQSGNFLIFFITLAFSGFIFVIDDFIKPLIGKKVANINPVVFLLGIFGGISTLGVTGFVLGPLITASFQTLFEITYGKLSSEQ